MLNTYFSVLAAATANTADSQAAATSQLVSSIVMLVVIMAIFYFMLIRPQKKKDKAVKNMLAALKPGDRICTIGGLYGTISAIKDDNVTITLGAQQNTVVIARWAIRSVEDAPLENDAAPEI